MRATEFRIPRPRRVDTTVCQQLFKRYLLPVLIRYASLVLQFLVIVIVTRRLSPEEAGIYFEVFGIINATYFLFGAGLPDGLVRFVAYAVAIERQCDIRAIVKRSAFVSALIATPMIAIGIAGGIAMESALVTRTVVAAVAAWWLCYGVTFFASQVLVATGRTSLGALFFYPAMNVALFATSVPYLLIADQPNLTQTLITTVVGGIFCAVAATTCAMATTLVYPPSNVRASIEPIFRVGLSISVSRALQGCLYWIPVWAVGLWQGAATAAVFGTASRLNVAIAAVIAALRFTIRPMIVRLAASSDWAGMSREAQRTAAIATATAVVAFLGVITFGPTLINLVFGEQYSGAEYILVILMVGTMAECIGGAVDEILKMTGRSGLVLCILAIAVSIEGFLAMNFSQLGSFATATVQATVFVGIYGVMLTIVWHRDGIWAGPHIRSKCRSRKMLNRENRL